MSRTALWITFALAAVIGLLALALSLSGELDDDEATPLLGIDPARVTAIRLAEPGRPTLEIRRVAPDTWMMITGAEDAAPWPVIGARVRTTLRILADATPAPDAPASKDIENGAELTLEFDVGESRTLRFGASRLGGRVAAAVDDGPVVGLDAALIDALRREDVLAWRETVALPLNLRDASRVRMVAGDRTLALGKVVGEWSLREPHAARANQAAAMDLLDALSRLSVARFIDDPASRDPETTGLGDPRWTIGVEQDIREIDGAGEVRVRTVRATLAIGAAADMEGATAFASPDAGRTLLVVRTEALEGVSVDPHAYAARSATDVLPSNVGMIILSFADGRESGYRRGLDGWRSLTAQGLLADAPPEAEIDALLVFLSSRIAPVVRLGGADAQEAEGFVPAGAVRLLGFSEEPLDVIEFGAVASEPDAPALRSADALRVYPGATAPALLTSR